jgi:hydrogenase maturation protease
VLAVGSPHGDDRVGWEVVERLRQELALVGVQTRVLHDPLSLVEHLEGAAGIVLVDACRSGAEAGSLFRLAWPARGLDTAGGPSTHGFGVASALALAEALGRLPRQVVLLGVEAQACEPGEDLSPPVRQALPELCRRVLAEVRRLAERSASGTEGSEV